MFSAALYFVLCCAVLCCAVLLIASSGLNTEVMAPIKAALNSRFNMLKKISLAKDVAKRVNDARPLVEALDVTGESRNI